MNKNLLSATEISELEAQDEVFKNVIAENLITLRHLLKKKDPSWGQDQMAECFSVSTSTYKRWEKKGVDSVTSSWMYRYKFLCQKSNPELVKKAGADMMCEFVALFDSAMGLLKLPSKSATRKVTK